MTRRQWLGSLAAFGGTASYAGWFEPRWLTVTRPVVTLGREAADPIRLLHVSDLHLSYCVPLSLIERAITLGLQERPDLICVTGDFITGREDLGPNSYSKALTRLSGAAPTFAVLGNHDGGGWAASIGGYPDHRPVEDLLSRSGIRLLHNRSERVSVRGRSLTLAGVGDLWTGEIDADRAFAAVDSGAPVILLAHNPDSKDELEGRPWNVMLSGHTHGGQVVLPFDSTRFAPVRDKRYVAGLKPWGDRQIHVSCGVGNLYGVRFRCRPEVNMITLA